MEKMIEANITSYIGQDMEAEHYYCNYIEIDERVPRNATSVGFGSEELFRKIKTDRESKYLTKKASGRGGYRYRIGNEINRFNTFAEIHEELIELFPNHTIVTYYEGQFFSEMLYYKDGKNLGVKAFGEVWSDVPSSFYKNLIPPPEDYIIRCENCKKEYKLEEVSEERFLEIEQKDWVKFLRPYDLYEIEPCCKPFILEWNVII